MRFVLSCIMYQLWLLMPGSAAVPHGFGGVLTVALQRHNLLQQQQTVVHLLGATDAAEGLVDLAQQAAPALEVVVQQAATRHSSDRRQARKQPLVWLE